MLIAGIDPGTVSAYAVLDLKGNIIDIGSERGIGPDKITSEITRHGKVFLIGSDVKNSPSKVEKIARKIGARAVSPDHNLGYLEKVKIVDDFLKTKKEFVKIRNKHEKDAVVAAVFCLKSIKPLIKKIEDHLIQHRKIHLIDEVKKKVLLENMPITDAVKELS